jgi:hypothetical protein
MFELGELSDLCPPLYSVHLYTGCCTSSVQWAQCLRTGSGLLSDLEGVCLFIPVVSAVSVGGIGTVLKQTVITCSQVLEPSGHYMYRQFNIQQFHVLPTQCIYVFCVDLRTNSGYFPIQH